jgi:hypothetical protein
MEKKEGDGMKIIVAKRKCEKGRRKRSLFIGKSYQNLACVTAIPK